MVAVNVNTADAADAILASEQDTVPVAPTDGVEHVKDGPEFWRNDTKVTPPGSESSRVTAPAASGPRLVSVMVYVTFEPAEAVAFPDFVTNRSACAAAMQQQQQPRINNRIGRGIAGHILERLAAVMLPFDVFATILFSPSV
jgi:hypothetical protein